MTYLSIHPLMDIQANCHILTVMNSAMEVTVLIFLKDIYMYIYRERSPIYI